MQMAKGLFGLGAFILILAGTTAWILQTGVLYQTGQQFYDACWAKAHANGKEPESPEQAAQWGSCQETADAALFDAGFIFAGNPENAVTPQLKAVVMACPSSWSEIPIDGVWSLAVSRIAQQGGPTPYRFRFMLKHAMSLLESFSAFGLAALPSLAPRGVSVDCKAFGILGLGEDLRAVQGRANGDCKLPSCRANGAGEVDRHDASPEVRKG